MSSPWEAIPALFISSAAFSSPGTSGAHLVAYVPLGTYRGSNFLVVGRAVFLHEPLLKIVSGQALEERPVQQFPAGQANLHAR
jgi:hypothetical protein